MNIQQVTPNYATVGLIKQVKVLVNGPSSNSLITGPHHHHTHSVQQHSQSMPHPKHNARHAPLAEREGGLTLMARS